MLIQRKLNTMDNCKKTENPKPYLTSKEELKALEEQFTKLSETLDSLVSKPPSLPLKVPPSNQ